MQSTPFIGITPIKKNDSLKFRVTINDVSHLFYNDEYTVRLIDSDYNILETISGNSTDIISKLFTFDATTYNLVQGKTYMLNVYADADVENSGVQETFSRYTKTASVVFGDAVYLGNMSANSNSESEYKIDIVFANSYKLSEVTSVEYFITNISTGDFVTSGSDMSFNSGSLKYNSANNFYYYTISCEGIESFVADETYLITMNFYTGNELVEQAEINYYNGG